MPNKKCMNIQMKKSMTIVRHAHLNKHTFQVLLLGHPYSQTHILRIRYIPAGDTPKVEDPASPPGHQVQRKV